MPLDIAALLADRRDEGTGQGRTEHFPAIDHWRMKADMALVAIRDPGRMLGIRNITASAGTA